MNKNNNLDPIQEIEDQEQQNNSQPNALIDNKMGISESLSQNLNQTVFQESQNSDIQTNQNQNQQYRPFSSINNDNSNTQQQNLNKIDIFQKSSGLGTSSLIQKPQIQVIQPIEQLEYFDQQIRKPTQNMQEISLNDNILDIKKWGDLQQKIIEEYNIVNWENNVKKQLMDELTKLHTEYYKNFIQIMDIEEVADIKQSSTQLRVLIEEQEKIFKNGQLFINELVIKLVKQPNILALLVRKHNDNVGQEYKNLVKTLMNSFFDNIIDDEPWDKEIMRFLCELISIEVERANKPSDIVFEGSSYALKFLKEYCRRPEFQKYTKMIFKQSLWQLSKIDQRLYMDPEEIYRKVKQRRQQSQKEHKKKDKEYNKNSDSQQQPTRVSSITPSTLKQQNSKSSINYNSSSFISKTPSDKPQNQQPNIASVYETHFKKFDLNQKANPNPSSQQKPVQNTYQDQSQTYQKKQKEEIISDMLTSQLRINENDNKEDVSFQNRYTESEKDKINIKNTKSQQKIQDEKQQAKNKLIEQIFQQKDTDFNVSYNEISKEAMSDQVVKDTINYNVKKIKHLTNITLDSIFNNLYNLPTGIRIVCKIIQIYVIKKFPNIKQVEMYKIMGNFLFQIYLIPQFQFPSHYKVFQMTKDNHYNNLQELKKILIKITRCEFFENHKIIYLKFNPLIQKVAKSMIDYYDELLNINEKTVEEIILKSHQTQAQNSEDNQQRMRVYCACITVENIKTLCQMIKNCSEEVEKMDKTLLIRSRRIMTYSEDDKFFQEDRKDIVPGKILKTNQMYVIIMETQFSQLLQTDFLNIYKNSYKINKHMDEQLRISYKFKNLLRQILISIERIPNILEFTDFQNILFTDILKIYQDPFYEESILPGVKMDNIPITTKVKYLLTLYDELPDNYKNNNMFQMYSEMYQEYQTRIQEFLLVSKEIKSEVLKAKENIQKFKNIIVDTIEKHKKERKRNIIYKFVNNTTLNICITSPLTRKDLPKQNQIQEQQFNLDIDDEQLYDNQIWIQDIDNCIHNRQNGNLEFIKNLNGDISDENDLQQQKLKQQHHCFDIGQLIHNFSKLPEVIQVIMEGDGSEEPEINLTFNKIINIFENLIQQEPDILKMKQNEQEAKDIQWILDSLEKYITRKIYDYIFPLNRSYKDTALYSIFRVFSWISYDHLNIDNINQVDNMWQIASNELLQMDNKKTPSEKLSCFTNCTKIMTDVLKLTSIKQEAQGADNTLPILIFIVLKAQPQRLYSNLNFIMNFSKQEKMKSEKGYCITQIHAAVNFLENLTHDQLSNLSEIQFYKLVYIKEVFFGLTYIKKRPRKERKPVSIQKVKSVFNNKSLSNETSLHNSLLLLSHNSVKEENQNV